MRKCPQYLWIDTPQAYARSILILLILLVIFVVVLFNGHAQMQISYLQVDLLSVGGLISKSSIHRLLEGEREDGGDPHVARGAHL